MVRSHQELRCHLVGQLGQMFRRQDRANGQTMPVKVGQRFVAVVKHSLDHHLAFLLPLHRPNQFPVVHDGASRIRDRVPMRIQLGVAQIHVQTFDQLRAINVFQLFCDVVHRLPSKAQSIHQKRLPKSVLPDQAQRQLPSQVCQPCAAVRPMFRPTEFLQDLDHVGHAGRLHPQVVGHLIG